MPPACQAVPGQPSPSPAGITVPLYIGARNVILDVNELHPKEVAIAGSLGTQPTRLSEIRVLIADERKLLRQGLISLFSKELGILIVGNCGDGLEAVELIKNKRPDVVVLNMRLPKLDGIGVARHTRKLSQPPELVFITDHHNESMMREAFALGARAYLLQGCDFKELVFAIRKVAAGDYYLTGPAGREMVQGYINSGEQPAEPGGIMTKRETELARLLAEGYSTKEAADRLNISVKTAQTHRASIMRKLRARNVTDIVKYCIRNNLTDA